jgi:hypothetical protein
MCTYVTSHVWKSWSRSKKFKAIIIVYVRGTSEAPNVGTMVGPPAFSSLRKAVKDPKKVIVQGVQWAALLSTYQLGGDPKGIDDMWVRWPSKSQLLPDCVYERVKQVTSAVKDCVKGTKDDSKIVMAGFSQGALMTRAAIKKLPIDVMNHVSAIVLWGDPGMLRFLRYWKPFQLTQHSETNKCESWSTGCSHRWYEYPRKRQ